MQIAPVNSYHFSVPHIENVVRQLGPVSISSSFFFRCCQRMRLYYILNLKLATDRSALDWSPNNGPYYVSYFIDSMFFEFWMKNGLGSDISKERKRECINIAGPIGGYTFESIGFVACVETKNSKANRPSHRVWTPAANLSMVTLFFSVFGSYVRLFNCWLAFGEFNTMSEEKTVN